MMLNYDKMFKTLRMYIYNKNNKSMKTSWYFTLKLE